MDADSTRRKIVGLARSRYLVPSIMMLASLSLVAYALTSVSVSNTVTIVSGANIQIIYQNTPFTGSTCPTTGYSSNPNGVSLVEPAGGNASAYLCVNNIGTGTDNPTVAITAGDPDNCGAGATSPCFNVSPTVLPPIVSKGFSSPTTLTISNNYAVPPLSPVTITITVT